MIQRKKISVVIPCFNEENGIKEVLLHMPNYVDEVIVVDNNSTDNTVTIAKRYHARVVHERIQGYGAALRKGIENTTGDFIITLDGDNTYPTSSIKNIILHMIKNDIDFISGSRFNTSYSVSIPIINFIGNKILTTFINLMYRYKLTDSQSGMFCFKKSLIPYFSLKSDGMSFSQEIKMEAIENKNIHFEEFPIDYHDIRRIGRKKLRVWRDGFENFLFLIKKKV